MENANNDQAYLEDLDTVAIPLDPVKDKAFIEKWGFETDGYATDDSDGTN